MPEETKAWMEEALHDLCQPLTALQCRLFLATIAEEWRARDEMEIAIRDGLVECERMIARVREMQVRLSGEAVSGTWRQE